MRFGFCTELDNAPALKKAGYDYIEGNLSQLADVPEEKVRDYAAMLHDLDFYAESFNVFYSTQVLVGENITPEDELRRYTHHALERAARLGGKIAVYGSSKARNIPEGFSRERAYEQFCRALRLTGDIAQQYGILVVLEPLNALETNFLHTIAEGLQMMNDVNHPNVCMLADMYHVCQTKEGFDDVVRAGGNLRHVHIAEPVNRMAPAYSDAFDYGTFAVALQKAGYDARISVECRTKSEDYPRVLSETLSVLKQHFTF